MQTRHLVHAILRCETCGLSWEYYQTAMRAAQSHATTTGHRIVGELGYAITIQGVSRCLRQ